MLYAVIDTNVIISAALAKDRSQSVPFSILQAAITKKYIPLVDSLIIEEYKEVLYRPKNLSLNSFSFLQGDDARGKV